MTYAEGRVIHDADSHVMETREWLDPYMDADLKAKLRPLYGRTPGRIDKLLDQAKSRKGDAEAEAKAFDNPIAGPKGWIAAGAFDPAERAKVLDLFGFSSQLVFGTSSLSPALAAKDDGVLYAGVRAHNEAMGAFCRSDKRLCGVAFAALDDPERARRRGRCGAQGRQPRDHGHGRGRRRTLARPPGLRPVLVAAQRDQHAVHAAHRPGDEDAAHAASATTAANARRTCTAAARTCASPTTSCYRSRPRSG